MRAIFGQVAIFLLGGAGNSNHMIGNSNHMLSCIISREQRLAQIIRFLTVHAESIVKECSLTAYKECSWLEPTIRAFGSRLGSKLGSDPRRTESPL